MYLRVGYEMIFEVSEPLPMLLLLYVHPSVASQLRRPDIARTEPELPVELFTDSFGNQCGRLVAPPGRLRLWNDTIVEVSETPDDVNWDAPQHAIQDLPTETLPYLLGSRYCEVDELSPVAWNLFGHTSPGWGRAQAVCDWVHENVRFGYAHARPTKTAMDVYNERAGVCRDFQHLAITFCRCLNIPARYATGYLGDIRVPPVPGAMDFSAWFEVYLGGRWYAFDARFNTPRYGRTLMAIGRDAVDCAMTTSFGNPLLTSFAVWTDEVPDPAVLEEKPFAVGTSG